MKIFHQLHLPCLFIFCFPFFADAQYNATVPLTATGQPIPVVKFEQGDIIGSLPYGQHFYIQGSTVQYGNSTADQVAVEIYDTGKIGVFKKSKILPVLSEDEMIRITARKENLIVSSTWNAYEAVTEDNPIPTQFSIYINAPLKFSHRYLVKFSYAKIFNYSLSDEEKNSILEKLKREAFQIFDEMGELSVETIQQKLTDSVTNMLKSKVTEAGDNFFDMDKIRQNFRPITLVSLESLGNLIPQIAGHQLNIQDINRELNRLEARKSTMAADSAALRTLNRQIEKNEKDVAAEIAAKIALEEQLNDNLQIIKNQLIIVGEVYTVGGSNETSVTELQSIQIGSSFGSGLVGLNFNDADHRAYDAFSYTALKFYFLPVDKRVAEPYLDGVFLLNRMSFIFGVATKGKFNYKGVELQKALAVTPMVGFGYDFSRYFSLDLGLTVFKQRSVSPFSTQEKTRLGPVLGLNFDVDVFNRFESLFSGDRYSIK